MLSLQRAARARPQAAASAQRAPGAPPSSSATALPRGSSRPAQRVGVAAGDAAPTCQERAPGGPVGQRLAAALAAAAVLLAGAPGAQAVDLAAGRLLFEANCAQCHRNGGNTVNTSKTLKLESLRRTGNASLEAIIAQVTKGKGAMPAFGGRLKPGAIQDVSAYVLDQAQKGWPQPRR